MDRKYGSSRTKQTNWLLKIYRIRHIVIWTGNMLCSYPCKSSCFYNIVLPGETAEYIIHFINISIQRYQNSNNRNSICGMYCRNINSGFFRKLWNKNIDYCFCIIRNINNNFTMLSSFYEYSNYLKFTTLIVTPNAMWITPNMIDSFILNEFRNIMLLAANWNRRVQLNIMKLTTM